MTGAQRIFSPQQTGLPVVVHVYRHLPLVLQRIIRDILPVEFQRFRNIPEMENNGKRLTAYQSCADFGNVYMCRQRVRDSIDDSLARPNCRIIRLTRVGD